MSLLFADNSTDKLDLGSDASIDNISSGTLILWGYWPSVANLTRAVWSKLGGTQSIICFRRGGDGTSLRFTYGRSSVNQSVDLSTGSLSANTWLCVCFRWEEGVHISIYVGSLTSLLVDRSSGATLGSGTHDDSAGILTIGQYADAVTNSDNMQVAFAALFNRRLNDDEAILWQFKPRVLPGCLRFYIPGFSGTGAQPDYAGSGINGTVTGTTVADHVPLGPLFGFNNDSFDEEVLTSAGLVANVNPAFHPGKGLLKAARFYQSIKSYETGTVDRKALISWSELEIPVLDSRGRISWAELEIPEVNHKALLSFAEFEVPNVNHKARISWAELEVPTVNALGRISWLELEVPDFIRRARFSWLELETPILDARGIISWNEFEIPVANRKVRISWVELEVPNANRKGRLSWNELEVPFVDARGRISFTEFEVPDIGGGIAGPARNFDYDTYYENC